MIKIHYTIPFLREVDSLSAQKELSAEIAEKIKLFEDRKNHRQLRVHKLKGPLSGFWSFSVNYKYRIIFEPLGKNEVVFHDIGNHDVYK